MAIMDRIGTGNTTVVTDVQGMTNVTYYETIVVSFNHERIILNNGGYYTVSTKCRMNQTANQFRLGYEVYQRRGLWYVTYNRETLDFVNGMKLRR